MAIATLLAGGALDILYLVTKNVEAGTLAYFFLVFSGIVDSIVFLPILIIGIVSQQNVSRLLLTALILLASYLLLAVVTYYMFRW